MNLQAVASHKPLQAISFSVMALLLGWVLPARFQEELSHSGSPIWLQRFLLVMLRWISPPVIAVGLVISVVDLIPS